MNRHLFVVVIVFLFVCFSFCPNITGFNDVVAKNINYGFYNLIQECINTGIISDNNWSEADKLLSPDGLTGDRFGCSVAIGESASWAIVGVPGDDDNGEDSGSAYIFYRDCYNWTEMAKLLPLDGAAGDRFGYSVAFGMYSSWVIIGAPGDDDNGEDSGSAYIFKDVYPNWIQEAKLLPSDGAAEDEFGFSVSLKDEALIGAPGDGDNGPYSGSAYVFCRDVSNWTEMAKLLPSDGEAGDCFGYSVSVSSRMKYLSTYYYIIGAPGDDDNGEDSGSAYIFKQWIQEAKLLQSDGADGDCFGFSVLLSGGISSIIGAPGDDDNGEDSGSAFIFRRYGYNWTERAKLLPSDGAAGDCFGYSVSISPRGSQKIIGAPGDDDNGEDSGSAYHFFYEDGYNWTENVKLLPSDGAAEDEFGCSVSITGSWYSIIGAPGDDDNGEDSGSAYVFRSNHPPTKPTVSGPISGKPGQLLDFTFNAVDTNGDDVRFIIDWGDGKNEITSLTDSGKDKTVSHVWSEKGFYTVFVKAEDVHGMIGDENSSDITIPRNKIINNLLLTFLQSHPNMFPSLKRLYSVWRSFLE